MHKSLEEPQTLAEIIHMTEVFLTARENYRRMLYNHLKYNIEDITNSKEINKVAYRVYRNIKHYPFLNF